MPMTRAIIAGTPLIGSKGVHDQGLAMVEEQMLGCRAKLCQAAEMWQNMETRCWPKWSTNP